MDIVPDDIEIGLDVWESVQPEARDMNPYNLQKKWGDKITFWGCLASQSTIPFGKPPPKTPLDSLYDIVDFAAAEIGLIQGVKSTVASYLSGLGRNAEQRIVRLVQCAESEYSRIVCDWCEMYANATLASVCQSHLRSLLLSDTRTCL